MLDPACCPCCHKMNYCSQVMSNETSACWCFAMDIPEGLKEEFQQEARCICADCINAYKKKNSLV